MTTPWSGYSERFIVEMRGRAARGIWSSPAQRNKEVDGAWPADWDSGHEKGWVYVRKEDPEDLERA